MQRVCVSCRCVSRYSIGWFCPRNIRTLRRRTTRTYYYNIHIVQRIARHFRLLFSLFSFRALCTEIHYYYTANTVLPHHAVIRPMSPYYLYIIRRVYILYYLLCCRISVYVCNPLYARVRRRDTLYYYMLRHDVSRERTGGWDVFPK